MIKYKISVEVELFHADRRVDGRRDGQTQRSQ